MRTSFFLIFLIGLAVGQDYQDVEKPITRLRTPRGPLIPNRAKQQALKSISTTTSTTTEAAPVEDEEAYYDEEEKEVTTTTSTEAPKKGFRGGVVRPFRSNADLIETLKRRRAQMASGSYYTTTSTTTSQPVEKNLNSNNSNSNRRSKGLDNSRKFTRNGIHSTTTTTEKQIEEPTQKSRQFQRGRRF